VYLDPGFAIAHEETDRSTRSRHNLVVLGMNQFGQEATPEGSGGESRQLPEGFVRPSDSSIGSDPDTSDCNPIEWSPAVAGGNTYRVHAGRYRPARAST
jgi:hypothetical protein